MATKQLPICFKCGNLNRGRYNKNGSFMPILKCKAFPKRIPEDIIKIEFIHTKKHPDQKNDILFKEV